MEKENPNHTTIVFPTEMLEQIKERAEKETEGNMSMWIRKVVREELKK